MAKQDAAPDAAQTPEITVESQQVVIAQLQSQLAVATTQVSSVTADRDALATANKALDAENESLKGQLSDKEVELEQAETLIEQQTAQLKSAEVGQALGPVVVTHENESYRVLAPRFSHKGIEVEATQLRQQPDLVRELVEAGSGLLHKVESLLHIGKPQAS